MKLLPGREYPPADEQMYIDGMIADLQMQLEKLYPQGKMLRQAHPKMHGCVNAEFTVLDGLDSALRVGIFREPRTYEAFIRFSNANTVAKHDKGKDVRGMAIKLKNVPGKKAHSDAKEADCQDFILINNEAFLSRNVKEFHGLIHSFAKGKGPLILFLLKPKNLSILRRLIKSHKKCHHVLDTSYWSTTPYLFGEDMAVKYHVRPANDIPLKGQINTADDRFLRTNLANTLKQQDAFFDFFVQLQTDADKMPVEDPTIPWTSPFMKVARIRIPAQVFDTKEQDHMGNGLSFSPWHSLAEHRPLGGLNRARKRIYDAMTEFWKNGNDAYKNEM